MFGLWPRLRRPSREGGRVSPKRGFETRGVRSISCEEKNFIRNEANLEKLDKFHCFNEGLSNACIKFVENYDFYKEISNVFCMKLTRPRYHDKVVPEPTMHVTAQWALHVRFQLRSLVPTYLSAVSANAIAVPRNLLLLLLWIKAISFPSFLLGYSPVYFFSFL